MSIREQAHRSATEAADRSAVRIRTLSEHDDLDAARAVWDAAWSGGDHTTQVTPNLLQALVHGGAYVSGAYEGDHIVGAALGLVARRRTGAGWEVVLHSHLAATSPGQTDRGIGTALKLHQRAWALDGDIATVVWTFDPLVRRNARLNLVKLGAVAAAYLPDFYGPMTDALNAGDPSDRLLVEWDLATPRVVDAVCGQVSAASTAAMLAQGAVVALTRDDHGAPVLTGRSGATTLVAVPADIVALRRSAPAQASAWRAAVRRALVPAIAAGASVVGLTVEGDYVVEAR